MEDFDLNKTIPIREEEGQMVRSTPYIDDFDLNQTIPLVAEPIGEMIKRNIKEAGIETIKEVGKVASIIRWPFWRFIEQPVSKIVTAIQEPKEKTVGGTLAQAFQGYVPFRQIPPEEVGSYGQIWRNYYKSITNAEPPDWYLAMASYGTAVGVEVPAIRAVERGGELALTRLAKPDEAQIIRKAFEPLKARLEQGGVDTAKLHPEGNIVQLSEKSELYINKYLSAVLRGDQIRVPRWAKIDKLPVPITEMGVGEGAVAPISPEILPVTGKEIILPPPKVAISKEEITISRVSPEEISKIAEQTPELKPVTAEDIGAPPEEPPKFPGVSEEFFKQPKPKTTMLQYFTPAEYHLKQLGFDAKIGQPIREALRNFSIELMNKNDLLVNIQKEHYSLIPKNKKTIKTSNEKVWQYMDKGIPEDDISIEANITRKLRPETEEMLRRINELNKRIGREEVKGIKNYILHMLSPEILNEIYAKGVIPPELAKVMEYIPPKNVFLRTAQQRKGVPEEWLVKDPYELMRAMYAIDLRYVYLQDALEKVNPYLKAIKEYHEEGDYWSPETYKYLDDWVKQAIKMRPSNWDTLIDNMLEYSIAPLLRKVGLKVSHMPWRDFVSTMSAAAHTGALGMRIRPILRNLVQSTFDWVMYGTQPYLKGSTKFMTKEGFDILKQSKVWKTRMPYEAQDLATLQKIFKTGSLGYRWSDLHNVGKGLLTRYYHAIDDLKMTPEEAIKWADEDLPATQWSYRREDLPRAYWTTTGRAFWTLGSWWMNFYTRFLPELSRRAFTGKDVLGRVVPTSERLGIMRLFILLGLLFAIKETSKEITGTAIDYTGQVKPTPLREAPIAQLLLHFRDLGQAITDGDERKRKEALRGISNTGSVFIPWYLAGKDLWDLLNGKKKLEEVLFYIEKRKSKKVR